MTAGYGLDSSGDRGSRPAGPVNVGDVGVVEAIMRSLCAVRGSESRRQRRLARARDVPQLMD